MDSVTSRFASQQGARPPQYASHGELKLPVGFESWSLVSSNLGMAYRRERLVSDARESSRGDNSFFAESAPPEGIRTFCRDQGIAPIRPSSILAHSRRELADRHGFAL